MINIEDDCTVTVGEAMEMDDCTSTVGEAVRWDDCTVFVGDILRIIEEELRM